MKIRLISAVLISVPMLVGCATSSQDKTNRAEAWSRCRTAPDPDTRDRCIETEIALLEARQERNAESYAARVKAAEERQAIREAQGLPAEAARESINSGLQPPKD